MIKFILYLNKVPWLLKKHEIERELHIKLFIYLIIYLFIYLLQFTTLTKKIQKNSETPFEERKRAIHLIRDEPPQDYNFFVLLSINYSN